MINSSASCRKGQKLLQSRKISDQCTLALDKEAEVDVMYLDFRTAFDNVSEKRPGCLPEHNGIIGRPLQWNKVFLSTKHQRAVNGTYAISQQVTNGIPKGCVLTQLLFTVYMKSMNEVVTNSSVHWS